MSKTESPTERAKRLKSEIEARIRAIADDEYLNACRGKWNYRAWPSGSTLVEITRKKGLGVCVTIGGKYTSFSLDEAENYLRALKLGCLTPPRKASIGPDYNPALDADSRAVVDAAHAEVLTQFNRAKERLDRITAIRDTLSPKAEDA